MSVLSKCTQKIWLTPFWVQKMSAMLESPHTHAEGMCLLTSVLVRAQLISQELIESFSQWLDCPSANLQLTAMAFFAELMKDPPIEGRNVLKILSVFTEKAQHRSSTIRQMAARALGNAVSSVPVEVQKHRRPVVQVLQQSLADTACPEVVAESMVALAELVRVLQAVNLGSAFEDIARSTKMFFESELEYLRYSAFRLYSVLASSASVKRSFFAGEVAETWVSLLLHLRDPDFAVASMCKITFSHCAPFMGLSRAQEIIDLSMRLGANELQYEVCSHLARYAPAMLERLRTIARRGCLENGQRLHTSAVEILDDILARRRRRN
ncbi:protein maestro-like [Cygnus atratus]|uniref:protein maestro-like n=1 Tax=Cygnus atratus TaxID=8868 RepID=UPI0015D5DA93|nr:protein maestro-like [Cygnus atratus]